MTTTEQATLEADAQTPGRDNCEFCLGHKGGVRGNENRIGGHVVCDYCTPLLQETIAALAAPPAGTLSDEQIAEIAERLEASDPTDSFWREFARAVLAAAPSQAVPTVRRLTAEDFEAGLIEPVRVEDIATIQRKFCEVIATPREGLFIVRIGSGGQVKKTPKDQTAAPLLKKVGRALSKPGISRDAVFKGSRGKVVYAYSLDPADPERLIREDVQGNRTVGRMVNGAFRRTAGRAAAGADVRSEHVRAVALVVQAKYKERC